MNERAQACEVLRTSVGGRVQVSPDDWLVQLRDFEVMPVRKSGRLVGAIITKGPEIHCGGIERGWLTRKAIRQTLGKLLDRYGHALTAVRCDNQAGQVFVERLGFEYTHSDGVVDFYRMQRNG